MSFRDGFVDLSTHPVLTVMAIAVASALLSEIRVGARVPAVVWEMLFGMLIGPHVLGLIRRQGLLEWLGETLGLAALFFVAGMEIDLGRIRGRPLSLALRGWLLSLALGLGAAAALHFLPFVHAPIMVALALTTTGMGTFMPMLRDAGELESKFGILVLAAGAVGEFGPVIAVSLVLTREFTAWQKIALMLAFVAVSVVAAWIAVSLRPPKMLELFSRTMYSSTQLPVCLSLLILALFDVAAKRFGFEAVLGAFAAGMVVGLASRGETGKPFREKIEAISFGFLVPFFFVVSGINLDLKALLQDSRVLLLVPLFLILFLVVRGAPVFLYRNDLAKYERLPFALYSATALPMVVAVTTIGVRTGRMSSDIAAALVGAGLLSVVLFPIIAAALPAKGSGPAVLEPAESE